MMPGGGRKYDYDDYDSSKDEEHSYHSKNSYDEQLPLSSLIKIIVIVSIIACGIVYIFDSLIIKLSTIVLALCLILFMVYDYLKGLIKDLLNRKRNKK